MLLLSKIPRRGQEVVAARYVNYSLQAKAGDCRQLLAGGNIASHDLADAAGKGMTCLAAGKSERVRGRAPARLAGYLPGESRVLSVLLMLWEHS